MSTISHSSASSLSTSVTTTQGNDLLLSQAVNTGASHVTTTYGAGETEIIKTLSSNNRRRWATTRYLQKRRRICRHRDRDP